MMPPAQSEPNDNPADRQSTYGTLLFDIIIFLLPALKFIEFRMGGSLYFTEALLLFLFLFMLVRNTIQLNLRMARTLIILCILWLYGQVLTDVIRDTPFIDYSRGWSRIIFTIINFSVLFLLIHNKRRLIVIFSAGLALGGVLEYFFNPSVFAAGHPWKFGVGAPLSLAFVLIVTAISQTKPLLRSGLLFMASMLNMHLAFRSMAGILFLTAVYLLVQWKWGKDNRRHFSLSLKNVILFSIILGGASLLLIKGYGYAASHGYLGEDAMQLYQLQSYGKLGLIVGGRSEILVSGQAIMDSPIIGHGSWAKNEKYADALIALKHLLGYYAITGDDTGLIPTHSHLFGSWVEAGIFGASFWIWVLFLPTLGIAQLFQTQDKLTPLFAFICFQFLWDIFFSPYAGDRRFITPYYIVAIMTLLTGLGHKKSVAST
jgi:hypothetical protein